MSAGFTKGPWHVETIDDSENDCVPIYGVCHPETMCDATTVCNVLVEADANLIAAAPELFQAAEAFLSAWTDADNPDAEARAAIALGRALRKAQGEGLIAASRIEARQGQDNEDWPDAKRESLTAESRDAQNTPSTIPTREAGNANNVPASDK